MVSTQPSSAPLRRRKRGRAPRAAALAALSLRACLTLSAVLPALVRGEIAADASTYTSRENVVVTFKDVGKRAGDWIAVYPAREEPDALPLGPAAWTYSCGSQMCYTGKSSGSVKFKDLGAGTYAVHFIPVDGWDGQKYEASASSEDFTVLKRGETVVFASQSSGSPSSPPTLTMAPIRAPEPLGIYSTGLTEPPHNKFTSPSLAPSFTAPEAVRSSVMRRHVITDVVLQLSGGFMWPTDAAATNFWRTATEAAIASALRAAAPFAEFPPEVRVGTGKASNIAGRFEFDASVLYSVHRTAAAADLPSDEDVRTAVVAAFDGAGGYLEGLRDSPAFEATETAVLVVPWIAVAAEVEPAYVGQPVAHLPLTSIAAGCVTALVFVVAVGAMRRNAPVPVGDSVFGDEEDADHSISTLGE